MRSLKRFIEVAQAKHGDRFDYARSEYFGHCKPIEIRCVEHGPFRTTPRSHLHTRSGGCGFCRDKMIRDALSKTTAEFVQQAREIHGDHYDYRHVVYRDSRTKVVITCRQHGPFLMTPGRHLSGRGCRRCAFERFRVVRRLSFWDLVERLIEAHGTYRYDYDLTNYVNAHSKIDIICPRHGRFTQEVAAHLNGTGCPRCSQSLGEKRVREALTSLGVTFHEQQRFEQCRDRKALPFDFYVPRRRLLIEYDGRQHFEDTPKWGGLNKLQEIQRRDKLRNRFAADHDYRLIRIPYWEYDRVEEILRQALGKATPVEVN